MRHYGLKGHTHDPSKTVITESLTFDVHVRFCSPCAGVKSTKSPPIASASTNADCRSPPGAVPLNLPRRRTGIQRSAHHQTPNTLRKCNPRPSPARYSPLVARPTGTTADRPLLMAGDFGLGRGG